MATTSLIIVGKSLDPAAITRCLKLKPSRQWKKGDRKSYQLGDGTVHVFDSIHKRGGWKLFSTEAQRKRTIHEQVARWLGLLGRRKKQLTQIRRSGYEIFLDCCIVGEADSISLSPQFLARLAGLGLTFEVTFYSSAKSDPNSPSRK